MKKLFYLLLALPLAFAACNETPDTPEAPVEKEYTFEVTSNKVMEFPAEGGKGLIEWVFNEVTRLDINSDSIPAFSTEAEWITFDEENWGAFTVAANEGDAREAVIKVECLNSTTEVKVKQEATKKVGFEAAIFECEYSEMGGDAPANFFVVLSDNGLNEDGSVKTNSTYYCLDIYAQNYDDMSDGFVTLPEGEYTFDTMNTFAAGTFSQMYSFMIKVGATEDDDYSLMYDHATLVVTSEGITLTALIDDKEHTVTYTGSLDVAVEVEPEVPAVELGHAKANYMGDYFNPGVADNFMVLLSDLGWDEDGWELPNAAYYILDLYTEVVDGELTIPYGTYTFDTTDSYEPNTLSASSSAYILLDAEGWDYADEAYFVSGSVTVDANGIIAELVAEDGTLHKVAYKGAVTNIVDFSDEFGDGGDDEILSTLWEDWYCNFSDCSLEYTWYGDYYEVGYDNWLLYVFPNGEVGDGLQLDLLSNDVGLFELSGDYVISKSQEKFTAYPGYESGGYMEGSWYFNADFSQYAPLVDGDIYITNNGDTTFTIEVDAYDDAGNNIYGSWTGVDPNQVQTLNKSIVVNNHGMKNKAFSPMAKAMMKR